MLYTSRFDLTTSAVISTDCIGNWKSNYHTITATTAPYESNRDQLCNIMINIKSEIINAIQYPGCCK